MSRVRLQAACDATGLTPRGVQAMAARGEIPGAAKIGRVWTFDADKLARWIRTREQATWQRAQDATSIGAVKRTANPCTPVRFRARPPYQPTETQSETSERIALRAAHGANEDRTATGTHPGTAPTVLIQATVTPSHSHRSK